MDLLEDSRRTYTGIWAVELTWNGERRIIIHSTHFTQGDANKEARKYFMQFHIYHQLLDVVEMRDIPDHPYLAFISQGRTSLQISVVEQIPFSMNKEDLKIALRLKGVVKPSGGKPQLMKQLRLIIEKEKQMISELRKTEDALEENNKAVYEISEQLARTDLTDDKENDTIENKSSEKIVSNVLDERKILEEKRSNSSVVKV